MGRNRNTVFGRFGCLIRVEALKNMPAVPSDQTVDLGVICAGEMRICAANAYFVQNAYDFFLIRDYDTLIGGVKLIENEITVGAWQLARREGILMLLQESPHFSLFPVPTVAKGFQSQNAPQCPY
ncbi:MAG: hypothetical protein LBK56_08570 [Gracilibacteraceae bacterium]|nr:hypothetical protein [Gracilibacteraceae bacterium]